MKEAARLAWRVTGRKGDKVRGVWRRPRGVRAGFYAEGGGGGKKRRIPDGSEQRSAMILLKKDHSCCYFGTRLEGTEDN